MADIIEKSCDITGVDKPPSMKICASILGFNLLNNQCATENNVGEAIQTSITDFPENNCSPVIIVPKPKSALKSLYKKVKKTFSSQGGGKRSTTLATAEPTNDEKQQREPAKKENTFIAIARRISNSGWSIFSSASSTTTETNQSSESSESNESNKSNDTDDSTLRNPSLPRINETATSWAISDLKCDPAPLLDKSVEKLGPIFGDDKREIAVRLALQTTYGKHVPADCKVSGATAAAGSRKLYLKSYFVVDFQKIAGDARNDIIESFQSGTRFSGAGKSGSWMLWSAGDKYIAKSLSDIEVSKAQSMLPNYFKHLETHPESLLTKYLAMFKMRISGKTTYVVIMKNVLDTGRWQIIYDLKGSTRGRICESSSNLLKDVNFTRSGTTIKFPTERALNNFKVVLQLDTGFLVRQGVLDYSLLLGTERDGREWQVGIIDIMTPFSPRKRMERMTMGRLHGKGTISCAPPPKYALRFFNFIQQSLEVNNNGV